MNTVLVVSLLVVLLGASTHGRYTSPIPDVQRCHSYLGVAMTWDMCRQSNVSILEKPLESARYKCQEKYNMVQCMNDAMSYCDNVGSIVRVVEQTFDYCDGNEVRSGFAKYFEKNFLGMTEPCGRVLFSGSHGKCLISTTTGFPDRHTSLETGLQQVSMLAQGLLTCSSPLLQKPYVPECGMRSGLKVVTDIFGILTLENIIGAGVYDKFDTLAYPIRFPEGEFYA